ncbi:group II intron maturase-specific domain-containing protein [Streptomyces humicola]
MRVDRVSAGGGAREGALTDRSTRWRMSGLARGLNPMLRGWCSYLRH